MNAEAPVWADWFDGRRALRQRVALSAEDADRGRVLLIEPAEGTPVRWPARRIRRLPDQAPGGVATFGLSFDDPARLTVSDPDALALVEAVAADLRGALPGPPLARRAAWIGLGGAAIIAALVLFALPTLAALLSRFMDVEAEVAMGEEHYEVTRRIFARNGPALRECDDPAGQAALDRLAARVVGDLELPYPLRVAVLDDRRNPIPNAYAVAGGRITFFQSLLTVAEDPDEIAAIFAHELGHVLNDDPVRHTLQVASAAAVLSVLIGDVTGGGILSGVVGGAVVSNYSRQAEVEADRFAHDRLIAVDLPPSALGDIFVRLRDRYGETEGLTRHFASHPQFAARIAAAGEAGDPAAEAPSLTAAEWSDLQAICD